MNLGIFGAIIVIILVGLATKITYRLYSEKLMDKEKITKANMYILNNKSNKQLIKKYILWEIFYGLILFILALFIGYIIASVFELFNNIGLNFMGKSIFILSTNKLAWFFQGFLSSVLISVFISEYICKVLLKEKYYEYQVFKIRNRRQLGTVKEFKIIAISTLILLFISAVVGMNWYLRLTEDKIIVHNIFSIKEQVYNYDDVDSIKTATHRKDSDGNVERDFHFIICLNNGSTVASDDFMGQDEQYYRDLLQYIIERSGKDIVQSKY